MAKRSAIEILLESNKSSFSKCVEKWWHLVGENTPLVPLHRHSAPVVSWNRIILFQSKLFYECFVFPIILRTFAPEASRADTRKSGLANRAITLSHGGQYDAEVLLFTSKTKTLCNKVFITSSSLCNSQTCKSQN